MGNRALASVKIDEAGAGSMSRVPRLTDVAIAPIVDRPRGGLVSPYDARYISLRPGDLAPLIDRLVAEVEPSAVDVVLAISESGVVPAFAFASRLDLPLVVATDADAELPQAIAFEAGDSDATARTRRIYPLSSGERVIIVEHHTVTGSSILSCVGALRVEGIVCMQAATLLAVDDDTVFTRLSAAGVALHTAALVPSSVTRLLYRYGEPPA